MYSVTSLSDPNAASKSSKNAPSRGWSTSGISALTFCSSTCLDSSYTGAGYTVSWIGFSSATTSSYFWAGASTGAAGLAAGVGAGVSLSEPNAS